MRGEQTQLGAILRRAVPLGLLLLGLFSIAPNAAADEELDYGLELRRVARVDFVGNEALEDDELRLALGFRGTRWYRPFGSTRYRPEELVLGLETLEALYVREGYHQVRIHLEELSENEQLGDSIVVAIEEGPQTRVQSLELIGHEPLDANQLKAGLQWKEGGPAPARSISLSNDVLFLLGSYRSRGHLGVQVRESLRLDPEGAVLRYRIRPGPLYTIESIDIVGNERLRESYIRRELHMSPGDAFDLRKVAHSEADLLDRGWFRDVSFVPASLDTTAATARLELRVVERQTGFYELGVGTGDEERARITGAWGDHNIFNLGRSLTLRAQLLWRAENRLDLVGSGLALDHEEELLYRAPHVLGGPVDLGLNAFFRQETRAASSVVLERSGILANTTLVDRRPLVVEFEGSVERVRKRPLADSEQVLQGRTRATTRSLSLVATQDSRDDPFRPRRGSLRQLLGQSAGGPLLGGDNDFNKLLASWAHFQPMPRGATLGLRAQAGAARAWSTSASVGSGVPLEDRFFAGGSHSVRGYRENSLGPRLTPADSLSVTDERFLANRPSAGGSALILLNAELRFPLPILGRWGIAGAAFADGGNVWEDVSDLSRARFRLQSDAEGSDPTDLFDFRTSVGLSLLYQTPVGPLRLDYGKPLKRLRLTNERGEVELDPEHVWHFSLGYSF